MSDRMSIGCAHEQGLYTVPAGSGTQFSDGCNTIWDLGLRALKVACTSTYATMYPLQTTWSSTPTSLKTLAQTTQFSEQLAKAWDTVVFTIFTFANGATNWWRVNPSLAQYQAEYAEVYELTAHLLTAYNNSGKVFVLQNWEGDWAFMDAFVPTTYVSRAFVDFYAAFFAARQRAVSDARRDTPHVNVDVRHAIEVNRVLDAEQGNKRILTDIAPRIQPDMVSYSSYDSTIVSTGWGSGFSDWSAKCTADFSKALRRINSAFPGVPVQIGEFGFPENEDPRGAADVGRMVQTVRDVAKSFGCVNLLYWQVFDNEPGTPPNAYRGYWLKNNLGAVTIAGAKLPMLAG